VAFAAAVVAFAAMRENDSGFSVLFRFGVMPLFLFSGTFFPVAQLPGWLHAVAYATPLWHGVDLCRSLALGHPHAWSTLGHVAYLSAMTLAGVLTASYTYRRRLEI
jgi:lipooligosaccharide transport system permease protein